MIVTAWNNGKYHENGAGYGLKISAKDIDRFFKKEWNTVILDLEGENHDVEVNINKKSFWKNCRELISKDIGKWLIKNGYETWEKGRPPKFIMEQIYENKFKVSLI